MNQFKNQQKRASVQKSLQTCSTHGLSYMLNSDLHLAERIFWALSFVCSFVMIFVLLSPLYTRFKNAPTVVSVEMDYYNWNVSFPAITVYPAYRIDGEALQTLITEYKNKTDADVRSYLFMISVVSLHNLMVIPFGKLKKDKKIMSVIKPDEYAQIAAHLFPELNNTSLTTRNDWPITIQAAMTDLGMCYVINSNVAIFDDPRKWRDSSVQYAKNNIELTIHDGDFYTQLLNHDDDEYKVYIHSPDEITHSSTASYTHETIGFLSLGIRVWSTRISEVLRRRPLGFRKCRLKNEPISERYPVYSYNHCMLECRIKTIKRLCGCIPHFYRPLKNETICTLLQLQCVSHYKNEILSLSNNPVTLRHKNSNEHFNPSETCGCLNACESDVYKIEDEDFVLQGDKRVKVAISSFPKVRVVKEVIFGFYDIILRSGGVVNLCMGSSIISIMELIVLGINFSFRALLKSK